MEFSQLNQQGAEKRPKSALPWWVFIVAGAVVLAGLAIPGLRGCAVRHKAEAPALPPVVDAVAETNAPVLPDFAHVVMPTPQTNLLDGPIAQIFQATASGRPESGMYGSVRTANVGSRVMPSFHEGLDIAPVARDRAGRALDAVFAVAKGRVGYVSHHAGNSDYGKYVVLLHQDPAGEVYTLYGHLAEVTPGLAAGQDVGAGTVLGRMGHSGTQKIPVARSHLHFEIGFIASDRFPQWMVAQRTKNSHGRYNGWNLLGLDPRAVLGAQRQAGEAFTVLAYLAEVQVAFELVLPATRLLDFFRRHPGIWEGGAFHGPALVVACSEAGVPLRGRVATKEEAARLSGKKPVVLRADAEVLGRNGRRIVVRIGGEWVLGEQGRRWAGIFLY